MTNTARKNEAISFKRAQIEQAVDRLGRLNEQIAALQDEAARHSDFLKTLRPGTFEGAIYTATVYRGARTTLDPKKVRQYLIRIGADPRWVTRNSKSTAFTAVRVS